MLTVTFPTVVDGALTAVLLLHEFVIGAQNVDGLIAGEMLWSLMFMYVIASLQAALGSASVSALPAASAARST